MKRNEMTTLEVLARAAADLEHIMDSLYPETREDAKKAVNLIYDIIGVTAKKWSYGGY